MALVVPTLTEGRVGLRPIRLRDARPLERSLLDNRSWLRQWEATSPYAPGSFDTRASIRSLLANARAGHGLPFIVEWDGRLAGQLNVSSIAYGSLSSATIGYWIAEEFAGRNITPTAVALATDYCFYQLGLHRMEICIRPENGPSLRVVEKLGFRYEGLRRRYIHINGDWRDHFCFALVSEELTQGVLRRWLDHNVPEDAAIIPAEDRAAAAIPLPIARHY
ncbi:ribosomal-protein-alanine N-acetyltransferase [Leifsonia sp. 98AMF]|uniref:GNAT family N-acetyltransferase n=1 Tax=Microbacteriaceae TaxID=85023 RepID=UPI00036CA926|nr:MULTISPECIES: GNAT family protein [Microbacteriaceae]TDP99396.1 ribosomal-protein-alanine N-acetyltransferase [Leifsonia sp. 115AMFTsu3.1]SDH50672.1 ribosomal-protein-alanine N-acetyltransferase [Leifsonia sp. 197AMF]SDI87431.1 ribosomal-protein-alanine N-acetyltransferase [Leifsonia sp. 466MF]SDJ94219.1 ribosomal-protein-alanine N-acetyltransferase [Leifsonia sp. 157MF]SDN90830.1 ribosomal-protein-alanine N-acetyltransferase [Leifsonia sp. 509MF]